MDKWRKTGPNRWCRGPLRVYANFAGDRWFAGLKRGRAIEDIDMDVSYPSPEAAMKAADKWARQIGRMLRAIDGPEVTRG